MTKQKKKPDWWIILNAMMKGETVSRLWASNQVPFIAQPGNRANELIRKGFPINKTMVYPENGAKYMAFWMTNEDILYVRKEAIKKLQEITGCDELD